MANKMVRNQDFYSIQKEYVICKPYQAFSQKEYDRNFLPTGYAR
jgi:hypothetical protein